MGVYDIYGDIGVQIKAGPCELNQYKVGDKVPIGDGVWIGYEGVVVVVGGIFIFEFDKIRNKWGSDVDIKVLLNKDNSCVGALDLLCEDLKIEDK